MMGEATGSIDVKKRFFTFFIIFYKKTRFYFFGTFLFSSGDSFFSTKPDKILLNLLNSCIQRLLSDGFNMTDMQKFSHGKP